MRLWRGSWTASRSRANRIVDCATCLRPTTRLFVLAMGASIPAVSRELDSLVAGPGACWALAVLVFVLLDWRAAVPPHDLDARAASRSAPLPGRRQPDRPRGNKSFAAGSQGPAAGYSAGLFRSSAVLLSGRRRGKPSRSLVCDTARGSWTLPIWRCGDSLARAVWPSLAPTHRFSGRGDPVLSQSVRGPEIRSACSAGAAAGDGLTQRPLHWARNRVREPREYQPDDDYRRINWKATAQAQVDRSRPSTRPSAASG